MSDYRIETKCVQAGYTPGNGEPRQIPIIQSTTFKYATSEEMGKLFDLEASGYFYSRLQNPTCDHVAAKIAALEGGSAAMLTGSGQAAITMPIMAPLADLLGVSRQTSVLAFQLGDAFTNLIVPTSGCLIGSLAIAKIEWSNWIKFMWKFLGILMIGAVITILIAVAIGF